MLLERLILKNFKRFRNQEIRFSDGITGIVGNNGTGKSSIVEGILFALYGLSGTGIKGDYVVSSFAGPRERCEVRLDFRVRDQGYSVRRSFRKGSSSQHDAWLNLDSKLMATGVSDVDREVTRILGMNATDLKNTIYAGQKDLVSLLESRPGERREWFSRVLGIDYLKEESLALLKEKLDAADHTGDRLEGERSTLTRLVEGQDPERMEASRTDLQRDITHHQEQVQALTSEILRREERIKRVQEEKSRFTRISEQKTAVERELESILRRKHALEQELVSLAGLSEEYEGLRQEVDGYPEERDRYEREQNRKARFDQLMQERSFSEQRLADLRRRENRLESREADLQTTLDQQTALFAEIRAQCTCPSDLEDAVLESWIRQKEHALIRETAALTEVIGTCRTEREKLLADWEIIRQAGQDGECPLCHQRLGDHFPTLEAEFTDRLQTIVSKGETACSELEIQEQERSRLAAVHPLISRIRRTEDLEQMRTSLRQDRHSLEEEKETVQREVTQVELQIQELAFDMTAFSSLQQKIRNLEPRYRRFQEAGKRIAALPVLRHQRETVLEEEEEKQTRKDHILEQLAASSYDPALERTLQDELSELQRERSSAEADLARDRERLAKILETIDRFQQFKQRISEVDRQQGDLQEEIRLLKLTRSTVSEFVTYLMQVVRAQIEQTAGEVLSIITDERYDRILLDTEFNLRISDLDTDYPIERFSGGEQDDIAVALRIALSHYLAELHQIHDSTFLIFDEIFGSQDEGRRMNLLRALRKQESHFPQILLISHIPEIQGEFANTLVVEMESDQTSVVREAS